MVLLAGLGGIVERGQNDTVPVTLETNTEEVELSPPAKVNLPWALV